MVKRLIKIAGKAKNILFADPNLLFTQERHLTNKPFFFTGTNGKGVLLLHGWTSTAYELRRLGEYLNENGYTVYAPLLTGHGTVPKDLENVTWHDWVGDAHDGIEKLKETCQKIYVGGTSIGANLAMVVAKDRTDIEGIVLMATPYRMRFESAALFVAKLLLKLKKKYRKKFYPPTFGLSTTITRLISYQSYPVKSVLQAFEIVGEARRDLFKIYQPCLIMQSTHDHIVDKKSIEYIYKQIGSQQKQKIYIQKAYHTFISDIRNEHVFQDILEFIENN